MVKRALVRRDVGHEEPNNYAGRDVLEGEVLYVYQGHTYGCIRNGPGLPAVVALSEGGPTETPFFEFPRDAVDIEGEDFPASEVQSGLR